MTEVAYDRCNGSVRELEYYLVQVREVTYIFLRGTELSHRDSHTKLEWLQDYWDVIRDIRIMPWRDCRTGYWGHAGFIRGARALTEHLNLRLDKDRPIVIAGHSLGGAIACALGVFLEEEGYDVLETVCFGAPKVFLRRYTATQSITLYQNGKDAVTKVPFGKHLAPKTKIGEGKHWLKDHNINEYHKSLLGEQND